MSPSTPTEQHRELLPERGLTPSPSAPNVLKPALYSEALSRVAAQTPPKRQTAGLVIPDYALRMAVLDFENFPEDPEEQIRLLRFRLRKTVPFPIEEARLASSVQLRQEAHIEVLVLAIAQPILAEYESIFTLAGYRIGMVLPSSIAVLKLCDKGELGLSLVAKATPTTLSVTLVNEGKVRLFRSIDLTGSEDEWQRPAPEIVMPLLQQTLAFAEDQIGQSAHRLILCGFGPDTDALGQSAELEFGIPYMPLRSKFGIASQENAGLLGLLEQYAA